MCKLNRFTYVYNCDEDKASLLRCESIENGKLCEAFFSRQHHQVGLQIAGCGTGGGSDPFEIADKLPQLLGKVSGFMVLYSPEPDTSELPFKSRVFRSIWSIIMR